MNSNDYIVALIVCVLALLVWNFGSEGYYNIGVADKPAGYYTVTYTGPMSNLMQSHTVAWVSDPSVKQNMSFNTLAGLKAFYVGKYDIIYLLNNAGRVLTAPQRVHSNPKLQGMNLSLTVGGPPLMATTTTAPSTTTTTAPSTTTTTAPSTLTAPMPSAVIQATPAASVVTTPMPVMTASAPLPTPITTTTPPASTVSTATANPATLTFMASSAPLPTPPPVATTSTLAATK